VIAGDITKLQERLKITVVYVTYDIHEALDLSHIVAVMNRHN
jgi:ABC-type proline/glycine betaine transport system ATPase subunit